MESYYNSRVDEALLSNEFMNEMGRKIGNARLNRSGLVDRNIIESANTASSIASTRKQLEREIRQDKLNQFFSHRPEPEDLVERHILEDTSVVAPRLLDAQRSLEVALRRNQVTRELHSRTEEKDLIARNILKDTHVSNSQRGALASLQRAMFEDKLKKQMNPRLRPSRDELIERGVIAGDVFDRIYKLSNAEAVAVLASLTSKNRGWESEVEYTLNQHDEDAIDDIEEMLEEKLLRRPDIKVLKEKGIIKQRGADPKLLATRNLSKKLKRRPSLNEVESRGIVRESLPFSDLSNSLSSALASRVEPRY